MNEKWTDWGLALVVSIILILSMWIIGEVKADGKAEIWMYSDCLVSKQAKGCERYNLVLKVYITAEGKELSVYKIGKNTITRHGQQVGEGYTVIPVAKLDDGKTVFRQALVHDKDGVWEPEYLIFKEMVLAQDPDIYIDYIPQ